MFPLYAKARWRFKKPCKRGNIPAGSQICVTNQGYFATAGLTITDQVQYQDASGNWHPLKTVSVSTPGKPVLGAGEQCCYPYEITFTPVPGCVNYRNVVYVTITNFCGYAPGAAFGPTDCAYFTLPLPTVQLRDAAAVVTDHATTGCPIGASGFTFARVDTGQGTNTFNFTDTGTLSYKVRVTNNAAPCGQQCSVNNTATLQESTTGQQRTSVDSVAITGTCQVGGVICCLNPCSCQIVCGCLCPLCGLKGVVSGSAQIQDADHWADNPNQWPKKYSPGGSIFFSSGKSFMAVLDTDAGEGHGKGKDKNKAKGKAKGHDKKKVNNAYYALAHQYIAAVLNAHNGAPGVEGIRGALNEAAQWFVKQSNTSVDPGSAEGQAALRLEAILEAYNDR